MTRRLIGLALLSLVVGTAPDLLGQPTDPAVGRWRLNVAKSKFSPGPAPRSQTLEQEAWDGGIKVAVDVVRASGQTGHTEYAARDDGKDYPVEGNPDADVLSLKRIDSHSFEVHWKKDGKPTITIRTTISRDGRTRTATQTGKNTRGQDVNNTLVFEKQ